MLLILHFEHNTGKVWDYAITPQCGNTVRAAAQKFRSRSCPFSGTGPMLKTRRHCWPFKIIISAPDASPSQPLGEPTVQLHHFSWLFHLACQHLSNDFKAILSKQIKSKTQMKWASIYPPLQLPPTPWVFSECSLRDTLLQDELPLLHLWVLVWLLLLPALELSSLECWLAGRGRWPALSWVLLACHLESLPFLEATSQSLLLLLFAPLLFHFPHFPGEISRASMLSSSPYPRTNLHT